MRLRQQLDALRTFLYKLSSRSVLLDPAADGACVLELGLVLISFLLIDL